MSLRKSTLKKKNNIEHKFTSEEDALSSNHFTHFLSDGKKLKYLGRLK
jgi:hypothetical protein